MRVLFISTMSGFPWGGSEELWASAAGLAIEQGHEVFISVQEWPTLPARLTALQSQGATIITQPLLSFSLPGKVKRKFRDLLGNTIAKGYHQLIDLKPDIVCVSQGSGFDVVFHREYLHVLSVLNVPYFIIIQHHFETGSTWSATHLQLARDVFKKAARLLYVSHRNREVAERQLAAKFLNATVVSNPVNLKNTGLLPWPSDNVLKMACVARYDVAFKGQDILLQALSADKWKSRAFSLRLYGAGPDENYLQELIRFYGLQEKVKIAGHTNDVKSIWEDSHLLVLSSISEGTPLSLIEANLCGRPAIGTDVGDIGRYVQTGKTGFLAGGANVAQLDAALEQAWLQKYLLEEMGKAAYQYTFSNVDRSPAQTVLSLLLDPATKA